jgi:hypothetical protein
MAARLTVQRRIRLSDEPSAHRRRPPSPCRARSARSASPRPPAPRRSDPSGRRRRCRARRAPRGEPRGADDQSRRREAEPSLYRRRRGGRRQAAGAGDSPSRCREAGGPPRARRYRVSGEDRKTEVRAWRRDSHARSSTPRPHHTSIVDLRSARAGRASTTPAPCKAPSPVTPGACNVVERTRATAGLRDCGQTPDGAGEGAPRPDWGEEPAAPRLRRASSELALPQEDRSRPELARTKESYLRGHCHAPERQSRHIFRHQAATVPTLMVGCVMPPAVAWTTARRVWPVSAAVTV